MNGIKMSNANQIFSDVECLILRTQIHLFCKEGKNYSCTIKKKGFVPSTVLKLQHTYLHIIALCYYKLYKCRGIIELFNIGLMFLISLKLTNKSYA